MVTLKPHQNVVKLYGISTNPMAIITEFCELGSLRSLLDDNSVKIDMIKIICCLKDIVRGMLHLHHEKVFHRDLSARNILVAEGKSGQWICKVSDFGLSRHSESEGPQTTRSETGPLKWMSPESLLERTYSVSSDVWSFGVTLYEILSREEPYVGLTNVQAASAVMYQHLRLKPPDTCPPKLAHLMEKCFETEPEKRSSFKEILKALDEIEEDIKSNPFY